jgi:hypothetical protein
MQLGTSDEASGPGASHSVDPAPPLEPARVDAVPDFMKEFLAADPAEDEPTPPPPATPGMQPVDTITLEEAVAKSPPKAPRPLPRGTKPGVVGTGMLGVVQETKVPATTTPPRRARRTSLLAPLRRLHRKLSHASSALRGRLPHIPKSLRGPCGPPAMALSRYGVQVLELMDRPVQRLSRGVRRVLGWAAVATLATSVIVYIVSLF